MNPLDMRGPEFLQFYIAYGLVLLGLAYLVRVMFAAQLFPGRPAREWRPGRFPKERDAYHIGLLRGGRDEVVRTLLARLAAGELIEAVDHSVRVLRTPPRETNLMMIEQAALDAIRSGSEAGEVFQAVRDAVAPEVSAIEAELVTEGVVRAPEDRTPFWANVAVAMLAIEGMGVAKLVVALSRGRTNVGFLVVLLLVFPVAMLALLKPPRATAAGKEYLRWLDAAHTGLLGAVVSGSRVSAGEVALCVAIFGLGHLTKIGPIDALRNALRPQSSGWADTGSSCGSGGGCGGGGCGGGGCGGCGG